MKKKLKIIPLDSSDGQLKEIWKPFSNYFLKKRINVADLVSHRFDISKTKQAYKTLYEESSSLGIVLQFNSEKDFTEPSAKVITHQPVTSSSAQVQVGLIGAGNYALRVLVPSFKRTPASLTMVCSSGGFTAAYAAKKFGFLKSVTDSSMLFEDPDINTVVIATRHSSHADFVSKALQAGKHVFVEKPLALTQEEILKIITKYIALKTPPLLMVGFNRRFSPFVIQMKTLLDSTIAPKSFIMTVNPGDIPADHWTQDPHVGGGRIVGEGCHFIDLLRFLAGVRIKSYDFIGFKKESLAQSDCGSLSLVFEDGSTGIIHYLSNGHKSFPKERLEVFVDGKILALDNFRSLKGWGWKNFSKMWRFTQDKGQNNCVTAFYEGIVSGKGSPIPFDELIEVAQVTVALGQKACL